PSGGFIHVVGRFGHGQHDSQQATIVVWAVEFVGNILGQFGDVLFPPGAAIPIDADPAGVAGAETLDNVLEREVLIFGRDCIFDVVDDDVGGRINSGGKSFWLNSID